MEGPAPRAGLIPLRVAGGPELRVPDNPHNAFMAPTLDVMFVGVLVLMALSLALTFPVKEVETRLTGWRPEAAKTF